MSGRLAAAYYTVRMRAFALLLSGLSLLACKSEAPDAPPPGAAEPGLAQPISLQDLKTRLAADRSKLVGKSFRVEGRVKSISLTPMAKGLQGGAPEGAPGALYAVPFEVDGLADPGVCWVEREAQQDLLKSFSGGESLHVTVEGVVEPVFGQLAPCKVVDKKLLKK